MLAEYALLQQLDSAGKEVRSLKGFSTSGSKLARVRYQQYASSYLYQENPLDSEKGP